MESLGDLGVPRGQSGQTVQRIYWNNLDTLLVSDLPSEARLQPGAGPSEIRLEQHSVEATKSSL